MTMDCLSSPSRETLSRSRLYYQRSLSRNSLQQEKFYAVSKRPRRTRFVREALARLENILITVSEIRERVMGIKADIKSLEGKIYRLDVIKEQACFFMSPKRVLSSALTGRRRSPMKLTYAYPPTEFILRECVSSTNIKLVEFCRRRRLLSVHFSKMLDRIDIEKKIIDEIIASNYSFLRFRRAQNCLIEAVTLQCKINILGQEFEKLQKQLFLEESFDVDSIYNVSH